MKTGFFVSLTSITLMLQFPGHAKVWQTPNGLMSDTCITKSGVTFTFTNYAGYVGSPCTFYIQGDPTQYAGVLG